MENFDIRDNEDFRAKKWMLKGTVMRKPVFGGLRSNQSAEPHKLVRGLPLCIYDNLTILAIILSKHLKTDRMLFANLQSDQSMLALCD